MNLSSWLPKWWLGRRQHIESILAALLDAREWGIGTALAGLSRTVRHKPTIPHRRFIPLLEELEPRYVFNVPVITGVTPDVGPITGGAAVTLTGTGFTGTTAVSFGNGHPAGFLFVSDTSLKVTAPAESPGLVDILVTNASGQSTATTADQYTYTNQPSITAVSPNQGSTDGGNTVTIAGLNLNTATSVLFGDKSATSFTVSKGEITAVAPAHAAGLVDVQVVTATGTTPVTTADEYTYAVPVPVITSVSPSSGSTHGGQQVTITGTDLTGATQVSFGLTPAESFNVVSATQILATAAPESAGTVNITVTTAGGTSADSTADEFTYAVLAPTITGVNPSSGPTAGGTSVVITGTHFSGATKVLFGTTAATSFTVVTPSEIIVTAPAGTAGSVDITVTTSGGTSATSSADQFTYTVPAPVITNLSPSSGTTAGDEQVLIYGTNLGGATAVLFGTVAATSFTQVSDTEITAVAPAAAAGTVDVRVSTAGGMSALRIADQFVYETSNSSSTGSQPTITGVGLSGSSVIITGTNFTGATKVLFGKTAAPSFTVNSDTQITATPPDLATGTRVSVMVHTPAGNSAPSPAAKYVAGSDGSGTSSSNHTGGRDGDNKPPALPSDNIASPTFSGRFAPQFSSSAYVAGSGEDGSAGTPTTAVSSSSWSKPTAGSYSHYTKSWTVRNTYETYYTSATGGQSKTGEDWGYHYQMTVTLGSQVIYSYAANSGGQYTHTLTWFDEKYTSTVSETAWSNDNWSENTANTTSSGTKGINYTTSTTTNKASGKDQTNSSGTSTLKTGPDGSSELSGTSAYSGTGTSTRSNGSHGSYSYAITGGNSTSNWHAGSTAHNGYTNIGHKTLGSDGIWVSSGSMTNHGSGTSYSTMSSKFGYSLTNSTPTGSSSATGSGHYSGKENGGWSYHDKYTYDGDTGSYTGAQSSHSNGTSNSTSKTNGNSHSTTSDGKGTGKWSYSGSGNGSNSFSASGSLGSDGIWVSSGSMKASWSGGGKGGGSGDGSFDSKSVAGSSSSTGAGTSTSTSTSGSTSSTSAASKMTNGTWTPTSGKDFYSDHGKSKDTVTDGGEEKAVLVGDTLTGPWSNSDNGHSNFTMTVNSVLGSAGQWTTTGTATEGGGDKGTGSSGESGTESLKNTSGKGVGSLAIKVSDEGHFGGSYHAEQTLTKSGGWTSVSGSATSTSGSTSTSSDNDGGNFSSATTGGDTSDVNWSAKGNETAHINENVNSKLGSGGIWITQGSLTITGSGSDKDSNNDKGKIEVSGDDESSGIDGSSGISDGSSNGREAGSDTSTSGSGSTSSNTYNAKYSLDSSGNFDPVSGSMLATSTVTSKDSINGSGDFGFTLPGGSDIGTWNIGGSDHSNDTATVKSILGSNGSWTTTGTDTGGGGGSLSSGFNGGGAFSISTGSVSSGNWDDETGTVTESGGDDSGYSDNYSYSLGSGGSWQGSSGSASANNTDTEDLSDDETDSYGEDSSGVEVTGTKVEDDSVNLTATTNDGWTMGADGSWALSSSPSSVTATVNDSLNNNFSGGSVPSGNDTDTLNETLTSSNGATPVVSALTETASGSFSVDGTQASFSVNVSGSPSTPTTTITETNTADLNSLSSVSVNDIDSLDTALITALVTAKNSSPVSYSSTWTYNSAGDLISATLTDSEGDATAWTFNTAGQLTSRTLAYGTPQAATTSFAYDANGNLSSVTDPDGNVTIYTYNAQNGETSMTDPLGHEQTMTYNAQGQLLTQTNRDGMSEDYAYNTAGQIVQETWYAANGTETDQLNFSYNTAGQMVSASNNEGTYTFSYNAQGQVSGVTEPFGVSLTFTYDSNGNRVEVQDSLGGTTQSSYNAANQLVSELFTETDQPTLLIGQSYNANGTAASQTYYSNAAGTDVVATTAYAYDNYGDLTSIVQTSGSGTVLGNYTYTYDTSGESLPVMKLPSGGSPPPSGTAAVVAAFLEPPQPGALMSSETDNGVTTNYGYDASNQLLSYGGTTKSYDLNGNRNGTGYVIGPDNQLLSDGTYNYTYDADGNEATKTNIATGDKWTYAYNNADQLVSAIETSASGTVETQVVIQYDVFGNRLQEQVWAPSNGWETTRFAYDAWDPRTPSGVGNENWKVWATLDGNNNLMTRYINGDALNQVFAQIGAGSAVAWYLTDRLGSTRALADNNGNVLDAITYDAWGNMTSQTNPSAQPLFMFTGIAFDSSLQLYFNGNGGREYDPESGRFIEQDPMQFRAGDSNLYRYVANDPTNALDPSGLAQTHVPVNILAIVAINALQETRSEDLKSLGDATKAWLEGVKNKPYDFVGNLKLFLTMMQTLKENADNALLLAEMKVLQALESNNTDYLVIGTISGPVADPIRDLKVSLAPHKEGPGTITLPGGAKFGVTIKAEIDDWEHSTNRKVAWARVSLTLSFSAGPLKDRKVVVGNYHVWFGVAVGTDLTKDNHRVMIMITDKNGNVVQAGQYDWKEHKWVGDNMLKTKEGIPSLPGSRVRNR